MARATVKEGLIALVAAGVVAAAIGGLALFLADDDEPAAEVAAPPIAATQPVTAEEPATPSTATTSTTRALAPADIEDGGADRAPGEPIPLPPMGIASAAFDWDVTDLPIGPGEGWLDQLFSYDGRLWAVVVRPEAHGEQFYLLTSADGLMWDPQPLPEELAAAGPAQFFGTEAGIVAVAEHWDKTAAPPELRVFVTVDAETWARSDLAGLTSDGDYVWLTGVAGGDGILVAAGAREPMAPSWEPPVVTFEQDGLVLEVDDATQSYVITDDAGSVVSHGSLDRIFSHDGLAATVYDPVTQAPLFRAVWEDLDAAAIAAYEAAAFGEPLVIEIVADGATMRLDAYTGVLTVADPAGAPVFEGTEEDLWRGQPPTFTDPRTGDVIMTVSWDEWEDAFEAAYAEMEGRGAVAVMLRSPDLGATWTEVDAAPQAAGEHFHFADVAWRPGGFLAVGGIEPHLEGDASEPRPVVLHSADGAAWAELPADLPASWPDRLVATEGGYLTMLSGEDGNQVVASADGGTWAVAFDTDDLELPLGAAWFDHVAHGGLGTFVTGMWDGWSEPEPVPVAIAKDGRTLTMAGPIYTVTDDATGVVLARFDESEMWEDGEQAIAAEPGFRWGPGGLAIFDDDGLVLFALSHRELEAAMEGTWTEPEAGYRHEQFVVFSDGAEWRRVPLPDDLGPDSWCAGIAVLDDRVVIAAHVDTFHGDGEVETQLRILVGTPR